MPHKIVYLDSKFTATMHGCNDHLQVNSNTTIIIVVLQTDSAYTCIIGLGSIVELGGGALGDVGIDPRDCAGKKLDHAHYL